MTAIVGFAVETALRDENMKNRENMNNSRGSVPFSCMMFLIACHFLAVACVHALTVDLYQDCESGALGDTLTQANMNASSHGTGGTWSVQSGKMRVAGNKTKKLPGTVTVRGGSTYHDTGTRTWAVSTMYQRQYVEVKIAGSHPKITVACYFTAGATGFVYNYYDVIAIHNPYSGVASVHKGGGQSLHLDGEACGDDWKNWVVNPEPGIPVSPGKTYWVCLNLNYVNAKFNLAVFDPDNGYAQVGSTITLTAATQTGTCNAQFGREDAHGDNPKDSTESTYDNIVIEYTNGTFPLLPDIGTSSRADKPIHSGFSENNVQRVRCDVSSDRISLFLPDAHSSRLLHISLMSLSGKNVYTVSVPSHNGALTIANEGFLRGAYLVKISDGADINVLTKIIISN